MPSYHLFASLQIGQCWESWIGILSLKLLVTNLLNSVFLEGCNFQRNLVQALCTLISVTGTWADSKRHLASLDTWTRQRMPSATQSNDKVFSLFKTCLASYFYHSKLLNKTLHSQSHLRTSHFMNEVMPYSDKACAKYPCDKTIDKFTSRHFNIGTVKKCMWRDGSNETINDIKFWANVEIRAWLKINWQIIICTSAHNDGKIRCNDGKDG